MTQNFLTVVPWDAGEKERDCESEREREKGNTTHFCTFRTETVQFTDIIKYMFLGQQVENSAECFKKGQIGTVCL